MVQGARPAATSRRHREHPMKMALTHRKYIGGGSTLRRTRACFVHHPVDAFLAWQSVFDLALMRLSSIHKQHVTVVIVRLIVVLFAPSTCPRHTVAVRDLTQVT